MEERIVTPEDIQRDYDAAMESVDLINGEKLETITDADWADIVKRNVEHLRIMVDKPFWTDDYDLTPFLDAIANH